ncbi:hypothetical protein [Pseudonocardia sp. TRM90224]|uniref:hypothetical protein n=1 Tax=Pseudonocardia sp. TRM90224 TaxID=2812678 RepID=UPI001E39AEF6|nr:hypothetical protein [Pseudonocardia sp. TRM90224]
MTVQLFTPAWAEAVRVAVDAEPDDELRAGKLPTYWEWIERARDGYAASWALTDPARSAHLLLEWKDGRCVAASLVDAEQAARATYALSANREAWRDLLAGADAGRLLMTRKFALQRGNVLQFFRGVYFVVEALGAIGRVPATVDNDVVAAC